MMRQCIVLVLIGLVADVRGEEPYAAAEAFLTKRFAADQPGAAVLVLKNEQTQLMKGYGAADIATKKPITANSVFDLASCSKQFTAMAIMQLAERGRLRYDDDVRTWIPELPVFEDARPIKLRDLLNHTSGLIDYLKIFRGDDKTFAKLTNSDLPAMFQGKKLRFPPGTKFEYSNTNYALLALVVERASGRTFGAYMRDRIFSPLEMNNTLVMDETDMAIPNRVMGYARPFWSSKLTLSRRDGPVCGDGNVFTNLRDLAKWDAGLARNALVRADTLALAYSACKLEDGQESQYGFGWITIRNNGRTAVWHTGGWAGTRTFIGRWLDDGLTIAVLCNSEAADVKATAMELAKLFRDSKPAKAQP